MFIIFAGLFADVIRHSLDRGDEHFKRDVEARIRRHSGSLRLRGVFCVSVRVCIAHRKTPSALCLCAYVLGGCTYVTVLLSPIYVSVRHCSVVHFFNLFLRIPNFFAHLSPPSCSFALRRNFCRGRPCVCIRCPSSSAYTACGAFLSSTTRRCGAQSELLTL